jgi:hypothetical protein
MQAVISLLSVAQAAPLRPLIPLATFRAALLPPRYLVLLPLLLLLLLLPLLLLVQLSLACHTTEVGFQLLVILLCFQLACTITRRVHATRHM